MPVCNASEPIPPEIHPAQTVTDPDMRFLLDHWTALKGDRAMPLRAEIVPGDIKRCLRWVHLYEVVDGGADFRARLVGSSVFQGICDDQTGKLISEHPDPGIKLRFMAILRHVAATVEPCRSLSLRLTGSLLHNVHTEGLWLPLGGTCVEYVLAQSSLRPVAPGDSDFGRSVL